jgi:hypothetical protein
MSRVRRVNIMKAVTAYATVARKQLGSVAGEAS